MARHLRPRQEDLPRAGRHSLPSKPLHHVGTTRQPRTSAHHRIELVNCLFGCRCCYYGDCAFHVLCYGED
jgi:hypothetical protein